MADFYTLPGDPEGSIRDSSGKLYNNVTTQSAYLSKVRREQGATAADAAAIRLGFQVSGPGSYTRTTGATPAQALAVAGLIAPGFGAIVGDVTAAHDKVAAAVNATPNPEPQATVLETPQSFAGPSAPVAAQAPTHSTLDQNSMLLIGGGIVLLFLLMRG